MGSPLNQQTGTNFFSALQKSEMASVDVLDPVSLEKICVPKCRDDLRDLRMKIESICIKQTDLITYENVVYPSTFVVDNYIYKWDVSCYKDTSVPTPICAWPFSC